MAYHKIFNESNRKCRGRKSLKNQTSDVIKLREMRGGVRKKKPKKEKDNPLFL